MYKLNLLNSIWKFFGIYQTRKIRVIHLLILLLVITQIVISNWMEIAKTGVIVDQGYQFYCTWLHIILGISLFFLVLYFIINCTKNKGIHYFFPYLFGDLSQIKKDIKLLSHLKLPESSANGIATSVQGLGLGALFLVVSSGLIWLFLWLQNAPLADEAKNIHKTLTGLIEIYIIGHGSMGLLHFILWHKYH
ncbi:cytochrome b/b6 domain-containing protein [Moellerella wisconsensis]|uniref:cytochrome b/b6 domain-containing protein n=1 Tax=Moellerella wisconsensis TaxID=158849 RepID=UPI0030765396